MPGQDSQGAAAPEPEIPAEPKSNLMTLLMFLGVVGALVGAVVVYVQMLERQRMSTLPDGMVQKKLKAQEKKKRKGKLRD